MKRTVVIVSLYNAAEYIHDLFGSLGRSYKDSDWVEVVAIDDQSPDETFEMVKREYPWVDVIRSDVNFGFAKANNVATEYALKKYDPEYLFYLNQDTEVEEGFLEKLVLMADSNEVMGIVQPLLVFHPFSLGLVNSAGNRLHFLGYGYTGDERKRFSSVLLSSSKHYVNVAQRLPQSDKINDIGYASGAAFLIRSEIVKKIGLFDPYYVAYHEDTDLSLRVKQLGYRVVLCFESRVAHKYTTPEQVKGKKQINHNAYYWIERNRFVLFAKFWTTRMLVVFYPAFVVNEIGVMVFSFFRGFWKERLRMYMWLCTHMGELRQLRKKTVRTREWERQLMGMLTSEVWHGNGDSVVLELANMFWKVYFNLVRKILTLWD